MMISNEGLIGAQLAFDYADRMQPGWGARAFDAFAQAAQEAKKPFTIEQIREQIAWLGVEPPTDSRAYGSIVLRAACMNFIRKTGDFAPARSSHGSPKPLWIAVC